MEDDNLIIQTRENIKLIKVKEKEIEVIQNISKKECRDIFKISNDKIFLLFDSFIRLCFYKKGYLEGTFKEIDFNPKKRIKNIYEINEDEIVISYTEEVLLFGDNDFLLFYNIKQNKEIKTLKIGKSNKH